MPHQSGDPVVQLRCGLFLPRHRRSSPSTTFLGGPGQSPELLSCPIPPDRSWRIASSFSASITVHSRDLCRKQPNKSQVVDRPCSIPRCPRNRAFRFEQQEPAPYLSRCRTSAAASPTADLARLEKIEKQSRQPSRSRHFHPRA